jgi:hypothetical protein
VLTLPQPELRRFCTLEVEVGAPLDVGQGRFGQRRIVPILGGRVSGPEISGKILTGGADWQTIAEDGLAELNARYAFETDDGAIVEIINYGFRHASRDVAKRLAAGESVTPDSYYMRSMAKLESGHPDYAWVNRMMFVGTGGKQGGTVQIDLYTVK